MFPFSLIASTITSHLLQLFPAPMPSGAPTRAIRVQRFFSDPVTATLAGHQRALAAPTPTRCRRRAAASPTPAQARVAATFLTITTAVPKWEDAVSQEFESPFPGGVVKQDNGLTKH